MIKVPHLFLTSMVLFLLVGCSSGALPESPKSTSNTGTHKQYATGLLIGPDEELLASVPMSSPPRPEGVGGTEGTPLPSSVDLSVDFPHPGDQGNQSSCVGWAVAYALKSYQERVERDWSLDTNDHLFSPAYIYNQIANPSNCLKSGSHIEDALELLKTEGVAPLSLFNYDDRYCSQIPSNAVNRYARDYVIESYDCFGIQGTDKIKGWIASGSPIIIAMRIDQQFFDLSRGQIYREYSFPENPGYHAMVVVGYDDSKDAFRIINSWGDDWGDGGYAWISYRAFEQAVYFGCTVEDSTQDGLDPVIITPPPETVEPLVPTNTPNPDVSQREIEDLLARWEDIHHRSDGPTHDMSGIDTVLSGAALTQHSSTVQSLKDRNCYWTISELMTPYIRRFDVISSDFVIVEVCKDWDMDSYCAVGGEYVKDGDSDGEFTMQYHIQRIHNQWYITKKQVIESK